MMNALHAMDEVISANDINMNIAAITPVVILFYVSSRVFKFLSYAVLKLGRSREETYASIRDILTDMERLLVMRDNPPSGQQNDPPSSEAIRVLGPDDLGMLMLQIHECRTTLWRHRRRFNSAMIRGVSEDLAELAGERGELSLGSQLQKFGCTWKSNLTDHTICSSLFCPPRSGIDSSTATDHQQNDANLPVPESDQHWPTVLKST